MVNANKAFNLLVSTWVQCKCNGLSLEVNKMKKKRKTLERKIQQMNTMKSV